MVVFSLKYACTWQIRLCCKPPTLFGKHSLVKKLEITKPHSSIALFFETRAKALPHSLIKKKFRRGYNNSTKAYSPGIKSPKRLAPASTQSLASHLILSRITNDGESFLRKTLALRFFQISHKTSNVREARPLRLGEFPSARRDHHLEMFRFAHCAVCNPWSPSQSSMGLKS
jgi:hypothetical protein